MNNNELKRKIKICNSVSTFINISNKIIFQKLYMSHLLDYIKKCFFHVWHPVTNQKTALEISVSLYRTNLFH